jgi:two-component system chemotaxis sensor kinase CheA
VSVSSRPGHGTRVSIRLPLTLAIIEGLLVEVGETTYVIPVENVLESLALSAELAGRPNRAGVVSLRGTPLPFVRLRQAFSADGGTPPREILVVVEGGGRHFGLVVDAVTGQGQIVIKPLAKVFQAVRGISATAVLGTGEVALILDVEALSAFGEIKDAPHGAGTTSE